MKSMNSRQLVLMGSAVLVLLLAPATSARAALTPKITVAPLWRPGTQLTTLDANGSPFPTWDANDDYRYVDAQIYVTTNVPFWATQVTCTVNPAVLTSYVWDAGGGGTGDKGDDTPMITWGPDWKNLGTDFTAIPDPSVPSAPSGAFTSTGALTITAASLGDRAPLGANGVDTTLLLATLRYRVKTAAGSSTLACTSSFLDRDGRPVVTPVYTAPPALTVRTGYTINGKVAQQARAALTGIGVQCTGDADLVNHVTTTDVYGKFTISTRTLGRYTCWYFGNITDPSPGHQPDVYLATQTDFILTSSSLALLPTTLRAGNVERTTSPSAITSSDVAVVTSHWNQTSPLGDANGDGKTDKIDLVLVGINYLQIEYVDAHHVVYDLPRDYNGFMNSRAWVGTPTAGNVDFQLVGGANKVYWATLSPDGSKVAYVQDMGAAANPRYAIFTSPAAGGTPTRITPATAQYNAFAPSWSPDGQRLAFICTDYGHPDRHTDLGHLCFIDASGHTFAPTTIGARLYPPAWLNDHEVLFAYLNINRYDTNTQDTSFFSTNIVVGANQRADMPSVDRNYNILIYRFYNGAGDFRLRYAEMNPNTSYSIPAWQDITTLAPGSKPFHVDVSTWIGVYVPLTASYYDLAPIGRNLMYEQDYGNGFFYNNAVFDWAYYNNGNGLPRWNLTPSHHINFSVPNPWWDGNPATPTDLYSLRNTLDIVP